MQKTQPLCCWEGVFKAPLVSNGIYSIVACVIVAAGICLPSRCLAMNVCSDLTIPAFGRHVTIRKVGASNDAHYWPKYIKAKFILTSVEVAALDGLLLLIYVIKVYRFKMPLINVADLMICVLNIMC
jgi:hypothetical protein